MSVKPNGTTGDAAPRRTRKAPRALRRSPAPLVGEDVDLAQWEFPLRSFYEAELDKLQASHSRGMGRKYADDPRIVSSLRKRAKARGWELDFLHVDIEGKPALIVRIAKMSPSIQASGTVTSGGGFSQDQTLENKIENNFPLEARGVGTLQTR